MGFRGEEVREDGLHAVSEGVSFLTCWMKVADYISASANGEFGIGDSLKEHGAAG